MWTWAIDAAAAGSCCSSAKTSPAGRPERLGYHLLHLLPWRRLGLVLEAGELGDELLWEQVTASGQQLAQLDEGNPALFQGTPQRQR